MHHNESAQQHHKHKMRIHIDRQPYEAESPTSAEALYQLAGVAPHRELVREREGNHEDVPIPKTLEHLVLTQDEHFYTEKESTIVVNGKKKETIETKLSFNELVKLAFENPPHGPTTQFTITYRNGPKENPDGTLTYGHSVRIKKGMVFNVTPTDKS